MDKQKAPLCAARRQSGALHVTPRGEEEELKETHETVRKALETYCTQIHGPGVGDAVVIRGVDQSGKGFHMGNTVNPLEAENFGSFSGDVFQPRLLGMTVEIKERLPPVPPPMGPSPQVLPGLTPDQLRARLNGGAHFVVVAVSLVEKQMPLFTGLKLTLLPLARFCSVLGPMYRTRRDWTLSAICESVLESLGDSTDALCDVALFTKTRAENLKHGAVDHLLTSSFVFLLCGYPMMNDTDMRRTRKQRAVVPLVPEFFRRAAEKPTAPGHASLEWILSLASSAWSSVIPPGNLGPLYLKYMFGLAKEKTKDRVRLAVCRFILRTRHDALMDALRGEGRESDGGDLYAACDALRASLVVEYDVGPECPSEFLKFLKSGSEEGCAPWTWMLRDRVYRQIDQLIRDHVGFIGPLPQGTPCKPVGLDAQQLCARVHAQQLCARVSPTRDAARGTLHDLMDTVGRYLLVRWRTPRDPEFFEGLGRYLSALRDPELRTFLTPRAWGFFEQCPECLPHLAGHFLSDACILGRGSTRWFVPESVLAVSVTKPRAGPSHAIAPGDLTQLHPRRRNGVDRMSAGSGGCQASSKRRRDAFE